VRFVRFKDTVQYDKFVLNWPSGKAGAGASAICSFYILLISLPCMSPASEHDDV